MMDPILKAIIPEVISTIEGYKDSELNSPQAEEHLYNKFSVIAPAIDKTRITTKIGFKILTPENAPTGLRYTPGEEINYVQYGVPIVGSDAIIVAANRGLKNLEKSEGKWYKDQILYLRYYSPFNIAGHPGVAETLADTARKELLTYELTFERFRPQVDEFNKYLKIVITKAISDEKFRRNQAIEALEKLKLF